MWSVPDTTGETPPVLRGHTLTSVDSNRAVLFGGYDWGTHCNETYLLDMESWVGSSPVIQVEKSFQEGCRDVTA